MTTECSELEMRSNSLTAANCAVELESGAKIFVPPDKYEVTLDALRLQNLRLRTAWRDRLKQLSKPRLEKILSRSFLLL